MPSAEIQEKGLDGKRERKVLAKTIESKDGEAILIRPFSWRDQGRLRDMHSRCSTETLGLAGWPF